MSMSLLLLGSTQRYVRKIKYGSVNIVVDVMLVSMFSAAVGPMTTAEGGVRRGNWNSPPRGHIKSCRYRRLPETDDSSPFLLTTPLGDSRIRTFETNWALKRKPAHPCNQTDRNVPDDLVRPSSRR